MPPGPTKSRMLHQLLGIVQGTIQDLQVGPTVAISFIKCKGMAYGAYTVPPMGNSQMAHFRGFMRLLLGKCGPK